MDSILSALSSADCGLSLPQRGFLAYRYRMALRIPIRNVGTAAGISWYSYFSECETGEKPWTEWNFQRYLRALNTLYEPRKKIIHEIEEVIERTHANCVR